MAKQDVPMRFAEVSEAARAPTAAPFESHGSGSGSGVAQPENAPRVAVAGTWLQPGSPEMPVRLWSDGAAEFGRELPLGLAAAVRGRQVLLVFRDHYGAPHLLRPVIVDAASTTTWRAHNHRQVLVLPRPLPEGVVPFLASVGEKSGLWFVPGRAPDRALLARGGTATVGGAPASWGLAPRRRGRVPQREVLVLLLRTGLGDEPVALHPLSPGVWRCPARRCVLLEDGAARPRLHPSDLPCCAPRERLQHALLWLCPGHAPHTGVLTADGKVAWAEEDGRASGPGNGTWASLRDADGQYLALTLHAFGDEGSLESLVLKLVGEDPPAWLAVGTLTQAGVLQFLAPNALAYRHVLALPMQLRLKRPAS